MVIKISEVTNYQDFLNLKTVWESTLRKSNHTVFSTWEWLTLWWKHFGQNKKLLILLAQEDGETLAIAPLMYFTSNMSGFRSKKIAFIGSPNADYNNFILGPKSEQCLTKFFDYLNESFAGKWASLDLDDISDPFTTNFLQNLHGSLQLASSRALHECLYIKLSESYDSLYDQLEYKFKQNLRRSYRNLEKSKKIDFKDYAFSDEVAAGMLILFGLHQKRWEAVGEIGAFADMKVREFNLELAQVFKKKNWLSLISLNVDNVPAGCSYGFVYNKKFYYYLHGVDPAYSRYSVGNLIVANLLKNCIMNGLVEFDFLRGDEDYKYRWTQASRQNYNIVVIKKKVMAKTKNWLVRTYDYQAKKLKSITKIV